VDGLRELQSLRDRWGDTANEGLKVNRMHFMLNFITHLGNRRRQKRLKTGMFDMLNSLSCKLVLLHEILTCV
jgi:hypothetical protein